MKLLNVGKVLQVKDGIILAEGLTELGYSGVVQIHSKNQKVLALALSLDSRITSLVALDDYLGVKEGDTIESTDKVLSISVDDTMLGKVINPLGFIYDSDVIACPNGKVMPTEKTAPSIIERSDVKRSLSTGILAIDAGIPIGKGQRELVIGDRQTGKTSLCLEMILNQKGKNVKCIYVSIGQKSGKLAIIKSKLHEAEALDYTIIVAANASDPVSMQYIAPYAATSVAEYFCEKGDDVLIIYDDLTKHSWAYREISLLLRRPAGREAYPGDVFYAHSRLLERALQFNSAKGGGSITAIPIVETQSGDISSYIPTNIISITDGQLFLDSEMFNSGQKPAINIGTSVSRVGGDAQLPLIKQLSGKVKLEIAQFRELETFAQFGSDLDPDTLKKLQRGQRIMEVFKQDQYIRYSEIEEAIILATVMNGYLDNIKLENIDDLLETILSSAKKSKSLITNALENNNKLAPNELEEIKNEINSLMEKYVEYK